MAKVSEPADLVLRGGQVLTVDTAFRIAESVAVAAGRIIAVGSNDEIAELIGPRTQIVDAGGRTVLPGINDSHLHLGGVALNSPPLVLDLRHPGVTSLRDVADAVAARAATTPPGTWIRGAGWHPGYLAELRDDPRRQPTRADLDAVSPEHPVALIDFSFHSMWLNTAAYRAVGIDPNFPLERAGFAVDSERRPSGVVFEAGQALIGAALRPFSTREIGAALVSAIGDLHREGITSYTEPGLGVGGVGFMGGAMRSATLDAYGDLARAGTLDARVSVLLLPTGVPANVADLRAHLGDEFELGDDPARLTVVGVKVFADGVPPTHTAWLSEPYCGGTDCGALTIAGNDDDERVAELNELVSVAHTAGFQVGVHAVGDRTIDTVVNAFMRAEELSPRRDARHYVIHGSFTSPAAIAKMAKHGYGLNWTPYLHYANSPNLLHLVGRERVEHLGPVGSASRAGVVVAASSDSPVTPTNWRRGLGALLDRRNAVGDVIGEHERIDLETAVRAYTINGAWQDHAESWKGSIEPGKVADLCILDGDLTRLRGDDLAQTPVFATVFDGRVVHQA